MALSDLSLVTQSLITLLTERVKIDYPTIEVVAQSPDLLPDTTTNTLSVYLYHAREDAHYKNAPAPGGSGHISRTPLSLCLYYIVTAHDYDESQKPRVLNEQKIMGYALKTMHDYPLITDSTQIGITTILHADLLGKDNHLQIVYRPVPPEEATSFWNSDDQRLIRFSAFYEVRVVLLEPEPTIQLPGYVLSVGNYILPIGVMHIASTHGTVRFEPPGGTTIALPASPARVALELASPPAGEAANNQLVLRGARLGGSRLILRSALFDTPGNQVVVDPALNPDWEIKATSTQLTARVQNEVVLPGAITKDVLPGTYGVSVQLVTTYALPRNQTKTLASRSNECPIALTPFVLTHDPVVGNAPAPVIINTSTETNLQAVALDDEIEVIVAGQVYTRVTGVDPPGLKEFKVTDLYEITIGAHFGDTDYGAYPFRLIIRGAEAPPFWIEVLQ